MNDSMLLDHQKGIDIGNEKGSKKNHNKKLIRYFIQAHNPFYGKMICKELYMNGIFS